MRTAIVTGEKLDTKQRPIPAILRTLQEGSRNRVEALRASADMETLVPKGKSFAKRSLAAALNRNAPSIIAEVKKASPSKGVFREDFDPVALVRSYREGGAAAISVVTEPDHFQGQIGWIKAIRESVDLPILRKDFIIDALQVAESAAIGADAILLIARILTADQIVELAAAAAQAELEVLYEAHDADDLKKICAVDAGIVGINARNLGNFVVDTGRFADLYPMIPPTAVAVAESGLETPGQIQQLSRVGFRGFLIGEALILSDAPAKLIERLRCPE